MPLGNPLIRNGIDPLFARKGRGQGRKKATIQIGGEETVEQALGISAKKLDLTKLDWKIFDGSGDSKSTAKRRTKVGLLPSPSQCVGSPYSKKSPQPQLHLQE